MAHAWHVYTAGFIAPCAWAQLLPEVYVRVVPQDLGGVEAGLTGNILADLTNGSEHVIPTGQGLVHVDFSARRVAGDPGSYVQAVYLPRRPDAGTAVVRMDDEDAEPNQRLGGTQAVMRAVDILIAVADGPISLPDLVARTGISKPTCHRIATALVERGLLLNPGRSGYRLGPMVRELARRSDT